TPIGKATIQENNKDENETGYAEEVKSQLNPLKTPPHLKSYYPYIIKSPSLTIIIIYIIFIALLIPVSILIYKYRTKLSRNNPVIIKSKAYKNAKNSIKEIKSNINTNKSKEIYKKLKKTLSEYICEMYMLSKGNARTEELIRSLERSNTDKEKINTIKKLMDKFSFIIYAKNQNIKEHELMSDIKNVETIINSMENQ
ncbi:MAG: hypothetical protein ACOCV8_03680, partial [Spirochaetota bacterium]